MQDPTSFFLTFFFLRSKAEGEYMEREKSLEGGKIGNKNTKIPQKCFWVFQIWPNQEALAISGISLLMQKFPLCLKRKKLYKFKEH